MKKLYPTNLRILGLGLGAPGATREGAVSDTAQRLTEYGAHFAEFTTIVKTPNQPGFYQPTNLSSNVKILPTLSHGRLSTLRNMIKIGSQILEKQKFDVITAQEPFLTGLAGMWLRHRFRIPLQVGLHCDYLDNPYWLAVSPTNRIYNIIGKEVTRRSDTVRVVSQELKEYVSQNLGLPNERVIKSPVRVQLTTFKNATGEQIRARYEVTGASHLILFVGRFVKEKSLETLLHAFARIIKQCPATRLVLVGDGPERATILSLAADLEIIEAVDLTGWQPLKQVAEYMAASDVLVLPSYYEGFGRVVIEAAACGTPSVATERAGPREIITDGETGYLVPVNDSFVLAQKVIHLLQHPEIARQMGDKAREFIQIEYDPLRLIECTVTSLRLTAELGLRK